VASAPSGRGRICTRHGVSEVVRRPRGNTHRRRQALLHSVSNVASRPVVGFALDEHHDAHVSRAPRAQESIRVDMPAYREVSATTVTMPAIRARHRRAGQDRSNTDIPGRHSSSHAGRPDIPAHRHSRSTVRRVDAAVARKARDYAAIRALPVDLAQSRTGHTCVEIDFRRRHGA
jgi:hypothetical protein